MSEHHAGIRAKGNVTSKWNRRLLILVIDWLLDFRRSSVMSSGTIFILEPWLNILEISKLTNNLLTTGNKSSNIRFT